MSDNKQHILDVAETFRLASKARSKEDLAGLVSRFPADSEAAAYLERIQLLGEEPERATDLRGFEFRPFFVLNTLILATGHAFRERAYVCQVVATGLTEFADYFDFSGDEDSAFLDRLQRRFFAYCLAQLSELGMEIEGILMTMKADALDQGTAYQVRACLEEGPDEILASALFTPQEKTLWKAVFAGEAGAWQALQQHLIETYQLPFLPAPVSSRN